MSDFRIAALAMITPWTVAVVCLILLGISVYYCAVDKKARDCADREREARVEAERREHLRQRFAADIAYQRTRDTERRMRAADRDLASWSHLDGCTCDIFDIGPRCDVCVATCTAVGHPHVELITNGQNHWCGVKL